ncbi:hypothetical protein BC834DRAFT_847136 [Gloeopeniophorella convolvens]|nr:hypothetical protein BC834DRAFT_847136 [Gloeopeniophorella convolvens]
MSNSLSFKIIQDNTSRKISFCYYYCTHLQGACGAPLHPSHRDSAFEEAIPDTQVDLAPSILWTAKFFLPLRKVDVLVNNLVIELRLLDQGSQIVVICADLACEVKAVINTAHKLEMEGANGSKSWTFGCAENLMMHIGDINFKLHAHVLEDVLYRLLLRRPFHHLLLCRLEDHTDGQSQSLHMLINLNLYYHALSITTPAHPPQMDALECYLENQAHTDIFQTAPPTSELPTSVLTYKKVARKVQPVLASLPEDFCTIRRISEDPLLMLLPLPTYPPDFTPDDRLTQE